MDLSAPLATLIPSFDAGTLAACDELVAPGCAVADFFNTVAWMRARV